MKACSITFPYGWFFTRVSISRSDHLNASLFPFTRILLCPAFPDPMAVTSPLLLLLRFGFRALQALCHEPRAQSSLFPRFTRLLFALYHLLPPSKPFEQPWMERRYSPLHRASPSPLPFLSWPATCAIFPCIGVLEVPPSWCLFSSLRLHRRPRVGDLRFRFMISRGIFSLPPQVSV